MAEPEPEKLVCKSCCYSYQPGEGRVHGKCFQCTTCSSSERVLRNNLGDKHGLNTFSASEACKFFRDIHKKKRKRRTGAWAGPRWKQPLSPPWRISAWRPSRILWQEQNFPWKFGCRRGGNEKQWRRSRTFSAKSLAARSTKFPSEPHLGVKSTTESRKKFYVTNRRLLRTRKGKKGEAKQSRTVLMRRWICHQPKAKTLDGMRRKKRKTGSRSLRRTQLCLTVRQRPWDLCRALSPPWRGKEKLEKAAVQLAEGTMASVDKCITTLRAWAEASRSCVNAQEATRAMDELQLLPALPYEGSDLKALQQQAQVLQQSMRAALPKKEPKGKAKAKAAPTPLDDPSAPNGVVAEPAPKRRRAKSAAPKWPCRPKNTFVRRWRHCAGKG